MKHKKRKYTRRKPTIALLYHYVSKSIKKRYFSREHALVDNQTDDIVHYMRRLFRRRGYKVQVIKVEPEDLSELKKLQVYINDFPVVIASRAIDEAQVLKRQNLIKVFLGRLGNKLIKYTLGLKINDTQCGFKLFQTQTKILFEKLIINRWGFDFELLFLAKIFKYSVKEVPVIWHNRLDSRVTSLAYLQTLVQVFQVRINYLLNKYK